MSAVQLAVAIYDLFLNETETETPMILKGPLPKPSLATFQKE